MTLRPMQAAALAEIRQKGGALIPLGVGAGKTLVSMLAPRMLDARRPLLLCPAALISKTEADRRDLLKHWDFPRTMRIISYEKLSLVQFARYLEEYRPDLIVADEAHRLKNRNAGVTKRVIRYMAEHPDTKFVAMSGTFLRRSLKEFSHLLAWALGNGSPLPLSDNEVSVWGEAIDEANDGQLWRTGPGALLRLAAPEDRALDQLTQARRGVSRRIVQTAGVVASSGAVDCDASLRITGHELAVSEVTEANFKILRDTWCTPDGAEIHEAMEHWRHARALALGLHYVWVDRRVHKTWRALARERNTENMHALLSANRPPEPWTTARKAWGRVVRQTLADSPELDTMRQVVDAVRRGDVAAPELRDWESVAGTFEYEEEEVWHDDSALLACEKWMSKRPGIVWVEHAFFGAELSRRTGRPLYGAGALDARGVHVRDSNPKEGSIIASVRACGTGQNLQAWGRNLVVSPMTSGTEWEQTIGRTHRQGQLADEVTVDVLVGCAEHVQAWENSLATARLVGDVWNQAQRILIADVVWPETPKAGPRWEKSSQEDALLLLDD